MRSLTVSIWLPTALLLALASAGCGRAPGIATAEAAPQSVPTLVRVEAVSHAPVSRPIRVAGLVSARRLANLAFLEGGRLSWVGVDTGAHVRRGQVLARIDATPFDAEASRASAQLDKARRDLSRAESLAASGTVPRVTLDDAHTGASVAEATLQSARFAREHTAIIASDDGVVDARYLDPGTVVGAGTPVLRVSGNSQGVVVRVGLTDRDVLGLDLGRHAEVAIDARPGETLAGVVTRIAPAATAGSGTFEVEVTMERPPSSLFTGLTAKVTIERIEHPLATVPLAAVAAGDRGVTSVMAVDHDVVRRVPVHVAFLSDAVVGLDRVPDGLSSVVVRGGGGLEDGSHVRVAEEPIEGAAAP